MVATAWQDAELLPIDGTSTAPVPLASLPTGSGRPHNSAWWRIQPAVDCNVRLDSSDTTSTGDTATDRGRADTVLVVYTADALAAQPNPDLAEQFAYIDDGTVNGRAEGDLALTAGTTYYLRLGAWAADDPQILDLVLRVTGWELTDWEQTGDVTRAGIGWVGDITTRSPRGVGVGGTGPDGNRLNQAMYQTAHNADVVVSTGPAPGSDPAQIGVDVSGRLDTITSNSTYVYGASSHHTELTGQLAGPQIGFTDADYAAVRPVDTLETEIDGVGTVLSATVSYQLREQSYDQTASHGGYPTASGSWLYRLTTPAGDIDCPGPSAYDTVPQTGDVTVAASGLNPDNSIPVGGQLIFYSATPASDQSTALRWDLQAAAIWDLTHTFAVRPPLARFKVPVLVPSVTLMPVCRLWPRKDGRGPLGGPKRLSHKPDSRQGGFRPGGVY